jgi:hypothetical protein
VTVAQTPSKTAYADQILARDDLTSDARTLIARTREDWKADPRDVLNRPQRDRALGVGPTRGRELEKEGLPAYLDNGRRLTPASLVYIYKIDQILASFPSDGPPKKAPGAPHMRPHAELAAVKVHAAKPRPRRQLAQPAAPRTAKRSRGRPRKHPDLSPVLAE